MRPMSAALLAGLLSLAAMPAALAQTGAQTGAQAGTQAAPRLEPTADAAVTYRVSGGNVPEGTQIRAEWLAGERVLRANPPGLPGYVLFDRRNGTAKMVVEQARMVMDMPVSPETLRGMGMETGPSTRFTRGGTDRVAGLPCTVWSIQDGQNKGSGCITEDGLLLRGEGTSQGRSGRIEAIEVSRAPADPSRFRIPAGFQGMQLQLPPGLGNIPGLSGAKRH